MRRLVEVNLLGTSVGDARRARGVRTRQRRRHREHRLAAGLGPVPGYCGYAATKAAIVSVTMSVDGRDAARRPGARAVPRRRADGDARRRRTHGGMGSQLVHSGGRILTVDEVAEAAVALVGTRRVVRVGAGLARWRRPGLGAGAVGGRARDGAVRGPGSPGDPPQRFLILENLLPDRVMNADPLVL